MAGGDSHLFAGIDLGSTMTKVVIMDMGGSIRSRVIGPTGAEHRRLANKVTEQALEEANLSFDEITLVVATGYGRISVPFADRQITELTCHAKGVASFFPSVRTALDIGGQDAKALKIRDGKLINFAMNDKCAAGTGRFLEVIADALGIKLEELGSLSSKSKNKVQISNTCTVFAQQEVISHLTNGVALEDIVAGLHDAVASRAVGLIRKLKLEPDVVFTGGVAMNSGVVNAVREYLGCEVLVPQEPLLSGAIGAAIIGKELVMEALAKGEPIPRKGRRLEKATFFK